MEIASRIQEGDAVRLESELDRERRARQEAEQRCQVLEQQLEQHSQGEEYFRRLTENALDLITILNGDGTIRFESQSIQQTLGYQPEDYLGKNAFEFVHPEDLPGVAKAFTEALQKHGNTACLTFRFRHKDGSWRMLEGVGNNLLADPVVKGIVFNSRDITERRRLEEQYLQSQKVAVVGRLAGGVAHDFNNILTAIMGYSELMLRGFDSTNPFYGSIVEIKKAAERAASLTGQLLAFSRKQMLQPKVLDLNSTLANMEKMLQRLIGEDIELCCVPASDLGRIKADPGQVEQVILNLVVNARDAMPQGGRVTVECGNISLSRRDVDERLEVKAGEYVLLAVTDSGIGMSAEVQSHLFEPFFTTKELGKGTGLGLATCHGIVKQSGGHIAVASELGRGTTFKVYLPRVHDETDALPIRDDSSVLPRGTETLLVVEDEPVLRELSSFVLRECGYLVLEAIDGRDALRVARENQGPAIDLLVTDVIMPEIGGKELAEKLRAEFPATKILFCSGYTEDSIIHHGVVDEGIAFLQKPYTPTFLARKVREVLDAGPRPGSGRPPG